MRRTLTALVLAGCGHSPAVRDATPRDGSSDDAAVPRRLVAYSGGYGPDIAWYAVGGDGTLTATSSIAAFAPSPSFLAIRRTTLFAVSEANSKVGAYAIDPTTAALTFINSVDSAGSGPAFVGIDRAGNYALVANYDGGTVAALAIRADGGLTAGTPVAVGKNAHMILTDPSNHFAFVPCLGSDYVAQLTFDPATGALAPNAVPHFATAAGAGPRHLAFAPDGVHVYLLAETASTLSALTLDPASGQLAELQTTSTRAAGATGANTGAEVWVHPSGKFVYTSNRGDDNIAVFTIGADAHVTLAGHVATGMTPRDFTLDPDGTHLYAANQNGGTITQYAIDAQSGMPAAIGAPLAIAMPSFVAVVDLAP